MMSTASTSSQPGRHGQDAPSSPRAKRQRLCNNKPTKNDDTHDFADGGSTPPPEIWAKIMEYLPFESVLSCAVTSRALWRGMPLVKMLHIERPSELHAIASARHYGVTDIFINCLMVDEEDEDEEKITHVEYECAGRAVHFLLSFAKLKQVFFSATSSLSAAYVAEGEEDATRSRLKSLIEAISAAYRCGLMSRGVEISGLCCPDSFDVDRYMFTSQQVNSGCGICLQACRSFPLESALYFESRGSSIPRFKQGRSHFLDSCLSWSEIESIVKSRQGGNALFHSEDRLIRSLSTGSRYKLASIGSNTLYIVTFTPAQREEIERVIKSSQIDIKQLSPQLVQDAIFRSFAKENAQIPPENLCYLSHKSHVFLKKTVGLPMGGHSFCRLTNDMNVFVSSLALAVADDNIDSAACIMRDEVKEESLRLVRLLAGGGDSQLIDEILASNLLLSLSEYNFSYLNAEVARLIDVILAKGTQKQREEQTSQGAAKILKTVVESSNCPKVQELRLQIMHRFISSSSNSVESVLKFVGIGFFTKSIRSSNNTISEVAIKSLSEMTRSNNESRKLALKYSVMEPLLQKLADLSDIHTKRAASKLLMNVCSALSSNDTPEGLIQVLNVNSILKSLSKLLSDCDQEVLEGVCLSMRYVLKVVCTHPIMSEGLNIGAAVEYELCNHLLQLSSSPKVQLSAVESIYWFTKGGHFTAQAIVHENGLACINTVLQNSTLVAQEYACKIISHILDSTQAKLSWSREERVNAVIDITAIDSLNQLLKIPSSVLRKEALLALSVAFSEGTPRQIKHLVSCTCVRTLIQMLLSDDIEVAKTVMNLLKDIIRVGETGSIHTSTIEPLIDEFEKKIVYLEQQKELFDMLVKKRVWLIFDKERKKGQAEKVIRNSLIKQLDEVNKEVKGRLALANGDEWDSESLNAKLNGIKVDLIGAEANYRRRTSVLKQLLKEAEAVAPKEVWLELLDQDDLPEDLVGVESACRDAELIIETLIEARETWRNSEEWKEQIGVLASHVEGIVKEDR